MRRLMITLLIMSTAGCIDPISVKVGEGGTLVVDGWITDQTGPYFVKISRSIMYDNSQPLKVYNVAEQNARVSLLNDLDEIEDLTEISPGTYQTNTMKGVVGRFYQLKIITYNGNQYSSEAEELKPVPNVETLQSKFQVSEVLYTNTNGNSRVLKKEDFGIYVTVKDPSETQNFYRWQVDGIFEFYSKQDFPFTHCWAPVPRIESRLELASDLYFNGQSYVQFLGVIPYDRPTMYLVHLSQKSLTASAYEYLKKISNQQISTGTLFDPPATAIVGNLHNENNPEETVLGYFGASSVSKSSLLVDRFKESGYVNPSRYTEPRPGDCRFQEANATPIKPAGF